MNIIGIGTDLVAIHRIKAIWDRFGWSFAKRILTKDELVDLQKIKQPIPFLAKRFAAKEAAAKALGIGFRSKRSCLTEIGVTHDSLGRPHLTFSGHTAVELQKRQVIDSHISLA